MSSSTTWIKTSGVNDAVHHFVVSFQQTSVITGSTLGLYFELFDGATAQCSVVFRSDGAILLTSGGPAGTVLATYTGAFSVANTWYAFEFEVTINNTTGSFAVRKNGNNVNDFSATSLNTRPTSTNNYANKLQVGSQTAGSHVMDDLFWQSGAAAGSWLGDIRCYTRMPVSDQSVQFSRAPATQTMTITGNVTTTGGASGTAYYTPFVPTFSGALGSASVTISASVTGHMVAAIYSNSGGGTPGSVLATSNVVTNPVAGANTVTFASPPTVVKGTTYWLALDQDAAITYACGSGTAAMTNSTPYGSFPIANPTGFSSGFRSVTGSVTFTTNTNADYVSEAQQDGLTTYVFDNVAGHADFYGLSALGSTPAAIIATTVRGYAQKSDAGTRTAAVRLKSGATTVASPAQTLTPSVFQWLWRTDLVDPNTGAAWTQAAIDAAQIGPTVVG